MPVANIVFDIGNVFVRWAPLDFLKDSFPDEDPEAIFQKMRPEWLDLNRGKMSLENGYERLHKITGLPAAGFRRFCAHTMQNATLDAGTFALQQRLKKAGIPLYWLSDNIHEIVAYYHAHYAFMALFDGGVSSASIGLLKPDPAIYQHLLFAHDLAPENCVFFDDIEANVEGARNVGMHSFVFTNAAQCEQDLRSIGFVF